MPGRTFFRKKVVARILYFLKILPVYRIRDGFDAVRQNDETFRDTMRVMENRNGVVILPEGNHATYRKLRQLKKGICRIAFQTAEASGFSKEINIVPVGLEYSHYWRFRQVLTVVYGHPIHVSEYYESYRANPNRAIVELRDRLSDEMKKVMVHIEDEENYDAINELRSIVNEKYSDRIRYPKLFRDQRLINKVNELRTADPESYSELCNESMTVKEPGLPAQGYLPSPQEEEAFSRMALSLCPPAPCQPACLHCRGGTEHTDIPGCLPSGNKVERSRLHKHSRYGFFLGYELYLWSPSTSSWP
ncbi:MAG: hypothetical protein H6545_06395 [Bacteroidales bacterium]|nr:hypothetical protein [Bacteroidales bacterium]